MSRRAATRSAGRDDELTAEVKIRRDGKRRGDEVLLLFHLLLPVYQYYSPSHPHSLFLTPSYPSSLSLSHFLIGMQGQARSVLQCGFVNAAACQRKGNRTAVAGGVSTHSHADTSMKPLLCCTRKPFLTESCFCCQSN